MHGVERGKSPRWQQAISNKGWYQSYLEKIGDYAFECCVSLISIQIPESVTYLGDNIFYDCKNLKKIMVPLHLKNNFSYYGTAKVIYY